MTLDFIMDMPLIAIWSCYYVWSKMVLYWIVN